MTISANTTPPGKSWMWRNWKWVVPLVMVLGMGLIVGFILAVGSVLKSIKSSDVYMSAMKQVREDTRAVGLIGEPMQEGWLPSGSINVSGPSGHAELAIEISGPKGKGTVYVVGDKSMGRWTLKGLVLEVNGARADLLAPPGPATGP